MDCRAQGYLPQDYEKLDTAYGSEADLRRCVAALRRRGLKALADVVINHRCAQEKVRTSARGWQSQIVFILAELVRWTRSANRAALHTPSSEL